MSTILGQVLTIDFTTHDPTTGQVANATAVSCQVFEDVDNTPIITPLPVERLGQIGDYRVTFLLDPVAGFLIGHTYNVIVEATVNTITAKANIKQFTVDQPRGRVINI